MFPGTFQGGIYDVTAGEAFDETTEVAFDVVSEALGRGG